MRRIAIGLLLALNAVACAGQRAVNAPASPAFQPLPPAPEATVEPPGTPDWFKVDHKARAVTMKIVAEQSNNAWTFNGYQNGNATITVPEGYDVTITFTNDDFMAHSLGVALLPAKTWPSMPSTTPVFPGAITSDPASVSGATQQGASETITFKAAKAGNYALVCFIPGHAASRMWIRFNVAAGKEAGVQETVSKQE